MWTPVWSREEHVQTARIVVGGRGTSYLPVSKLGEPGGRSGQRINHPGSPKSPRAPRAFHAISLERRKVAWARINPNLKSLTLEEYPDRKNQQFGPSSLEKASK